MDIEAKFQRLKKEVAHLFEKFEEEVGLSGGMVHADSGDNGPPPPPPNKPHL